MPLIDLAFKRVTIDLIDPITPASDKRQCYALNLVDYATRYPEAICLENIDNETAAEALLDVYCRVGIPEKAFCNLRTQFVSDCMQEMSRTEKFNGTLKKMLRRMCIEQSNQQYIDILLFAYRKIAQASKRLPIFHLSSFYMVVLCGDPWWFWKNFGQARVNLMTSRSVINMFQR